MDIYRKKNPVVQKTKKPPGRAPTWTDEFMYMVASKVTDEGMKYREAVKLFGVSHGAISSWKKKYQKGLIGPSTDHKFKEENTELAMFRMKEQIQELKAEIGDLYIQNQLLKKAIVTSRQKKKENSSVITPDNLDQFQKDVK
ncbi:MAG: helix-turn-helix domain-containing protein [Bdellovibrionaceae bacterium]|nr:helix-turn-helix domain-containing protein [Pseudobdellovibrionaceae bacterium]